MGGLCCGAEVQPPQDCGYPFPGDPLTDFWGRQEGGEIARLHDEANGLLVRGRVKSSIARFNELAEKHSKCKSFLWRRGVALYLRGEYEEAEEQFRACAAASPNNAELSFWLFAAQAMSQYDPDSPGSAQKQKLMQTKPKDPRPELQVLVKLFTGETSADAVRDVAVQSQRFEDPSRASFYLWFYLGLYDETQYQFGAAGCAISSALRPTHARETGDFLAAVARVHSHRMGWGEFEMESDYDD
eukprot:Hpha_TRINITY_DN20624_c0_g1::TRINITY_DN20624_c0_g1_i1::g.148046::m.148046